MPDWVAWTITAAALAVGEMFTLTFFLGPMAIAAVIAAVVAGAGAPVEAQAAVFVACAAASLAVVRPIARRHMRTPGALRTGTAALVGRRALVLERVDGLGGQVKIGGEVWTARAFDDSDVFEAGEQVDVLKIDGATALVAE